VESRRVVVTGLGALTPVGNTAEEFWSSLVHGRSGIGRWLYGSVADGVLRGYFLGSYSARKLGLESTANAGGAHNLVVPGTEDLTALLRRMGRGLFVTEQLGQGVNPVTGDYSRGAAGFWIEDGQIAYPVEEITIAGNLKEMFRNIVALGNDLELRGSRHVGSMLIARMTIAGS